MYISSTHSTNTLLKELIAKGEEPRFIYAGYQTAGRGQSGNGWESEEGKNLLCSILIKSTEHRTQSTEHRTQDTDLFCPFYLNVAVSVAVHRVIQSVLCQQSGPCSLSEAVSIKWPNDIYWQDKKIAGILIENAIIGNELKYAIAGIGLNVNQTEFVSNAPNPVSLKQITGKNYNLDELMHRLYEEVQKALQEDVWEEYKAHLYRREGFWPFVEREVTTTPTMNADPTAQGQFMARIREVLPTGEIVLEDQEGKERKYHFKQIRYVV